MHCDDFIKKLRFYIIGFPSPGASTFSSGWASTTSASTGVFASGSDTGATGFSSRSGKGLPSGCFTGLAAGLVTFKPFGGADFFITGLSAFVLLLF